MCSVAVNNFLFICDMGNVVGVHYLYDQHCHSSLAVTMVNGKTERVEIIFAYLDPRTSIIYEQLKYSMEGFRTKTSRFSIIEPTAFTHLLFTANDSTIT